MKVELREVMHYYLNSVDVIIDSVSPDFKSHFGHQPGHKTQLVPILYAVILEGGCTVKLILRKLSDMTEEEAKKLLSMDESNGLEKIYRITNTGVFYKIRGIHSPLAKYFDLCNANQFPYLLSRGFDLWNLIESGQAIDKATLKKESV